MIEWRSKREAATSYLKAPAGLSRRSRLVAIRRPKAIMDLAKYVRDIPDFPVEGILFKDITPLLQSAQAFRESVQVLT